MSVSTFTPIISSDNWQIVEESHTPLKRTTHTRHQSEAELEEKLVSDLSQLGYARADITTTDALVANLRQQIERLNGISFSDVEWQRFYETSISNPNMHIEEKATLIHDGDAKVDFTFDDGSHRNVILIDKRDIHRNYCQVIHQFVEKEGVHDVRYDVTILINGLPLVHIELKRRGKDIQEAFSQVGRYARDAFLAGDRLYEYVQMFVISNGTDTRYYANTSRQWEIKNHDGRQSGHEIVDADGFLFTTRWADRQNKVITDLEEVTQTLLTKRVLLPMLFRYSVLTVDKELRILRPYQVAEVERMLQQVIDANRYGREHTVDAGGYVWATTGSGKTLTSYKTAQLIAAEFPCKVDGAPDDSMGVDKVLFVVDRKDLDDQTVREYNKFEDKCVDGNKTTRVLQRQLEDKDAKGNPRRQRLVVTTIQKLANFVSGNQGHPIRDKRVVIIFDECHRSQFGKMHKMITSFFRKYIIFGLTGTPIFEENARAQSSSLPTTTRQLFGKELHRYTIVDAIRDETVLKFNLQIKDTFHVAENVRNGKVTDIDRKGALRSPARIKAISEDILSCYDTVCKRDSVYAHKITPAKPKPDDEREKRIVRGFNAILCCDSVDMAIRYYDELVRQNREQPKRKQKVIASIFTFAANEEAYGNGILADETFDLTHMDASSRDALDRIMRDYNAQFGTAFSTDGNSFDGYYRDVCRRMKNHEIDLLVVVNMLLTGFDAKCLGTLFIDKNLRQHGLIQAASRTNRIYNKWKNAGNIISYRDITKEMDEALALFGNGDETAEIVLLKSYEDYHDGYDDSSGKHHEGYAEVVAEIRRRWKSGEFPVGEKETRDFVVLFGRMLRLINILSSFDQFAKDGLLMEDWEQDNYTSVYLGLREKLRRQSDSQAEGINDDLVFEVELVRNISLDLDYILALVMEAHRKEGRVDGKTRKRAEAATNANPDLRDKLPLILSFVDAMNAGKAEDTDDGWTGHVEERMTEEMEQMCDKHSLYLDRVNVMMRDAFESGVLRLGGARVANVMRDDDLFGNYDEDAVTESLSKFFEKFVGLV